VKKHIFVTSFLCFVFVAAAHADIFTSPEVTEEQQILNELRGKAPKIKEGEIARCRGIFVDLWGCDGTDKTLCRSVEKINKVLALQGRSETLQMFMWHSAWQEWLKNDPAYVPLVPPYLLNCDNDPCVVSAPTPEPGE